MESQGGGRGKRGESGQNVAATEGRAVGLKKARTGLHARGGLENILKIGGRHGYSPHRGGKKKLSRTGRGVE